MSRRKDKARRLQESQGAEPLNVFGSGVLNALGDLPPGDVQHQPEESAPAKTSKRGQKNMNRGRVDIERQTSGRGGKGVTVVKNFKGIGLPEKQGLAKKIQKACGAGGSVKNGNIEIQGDKREDVKRILTEAGFQPVFTGG